MNQNVIKAQECLQEQQIDYFLITNLINTAYISGLHSTNALILITPDKTFLFTDPRYSQESQGLGEFEIEIGRDILGMALKHVPPTVKLYVDETLTYVQFEKIKNTLPQLQVETRPKLIEAVRLVKSSTELEAIKRASEISASVWNQLIQEPFVGRSEVQIARRIHCLILEFGGDGLAFDSIVAAGINSASPHHAPTHYLIQRGDFIKCDFGAKFAQYHSDMTRMAIAGVANTWQQEIYDVVAEAQAAAVSTITSGVSSQIIDSEARRIIQEAGYGYAFTHPTGHGIGLEIHEIPIHGSQDITLRSSMTLTVEPGIYLEGKGGVRLEDTLVVLEEGSQNLTMASKSLAQVD